jgi:hypothetical protein
MVNNDLILNIDDVVKWCKHKIKDTNSHNYSTQRKE